MKRILFIDDSPLVLRNMQALLKDRYIVDMATNKIQAFSRLEKDKPDMIFLDYEMPDMNGKMMFMLIRGDKRYEDIPVVFLTSMSDKAHIKPILALKPDGYILKPASQEQIFEVIDKLIG